MQDDVEIEVVEEEEEEVRPPATGINAMSGP